MIINGTVTGVIVVIIGYLLGSVPSAYVITRLVTGKDVRKVDGGNVGARNVFVNVGKAAGIGVGLFDVAKGAGAVLLATWLLGPPTISQLGEFRFFILGAGVAAVVGHIWPVYFKFSGGNGLATTLGVLAITMTEELIIALGIIVILWVVTHNVILSTNLSLFTLPISGWLLTGSWLLVVFPIILIVVMLLNFFPVILADVARAGNRENFFDELLRRKKKEQRKRKG